MTEKLNFKLDNRIKSIDDIQTIISNNRGFIGCKGFFFDNYVQAKVLTKTHYGTLVDIDGNDDNDLCFKARDKNGIDFVGYFRLFIPEDALKPVEKKYRPFTGIEFAEKFDLKLGGIIRLKNIISQYKYKTIFTGYRWYGDDFEVFLNGDWIDMPTLLNTYEYDEDNEWKKFGVEE